MELTFAPRDILQINDARIIYRNLRGEGSKFNREGDRNFAVVIPNQELADELIDRGWNVKIKEPRDEGEEPFRYLPVKVKFNDRGPQVYLVSGTAHRELSEDKLKEKIQGAIYVKVNENDSLVIKITRRDENNFDMSFTDFSNKFLNGFSTDYAAYEVQKKYQKFVMKQFFK